MIIPIFIPHGGCPERCTFCDQNVSGGEPISIQAMTQTIESYLNTQNDGEMTEVAFYGGTFTALSRERQTRYLEAVAPYLSSKRVQSIRIATRPDALDVAWIRTLRDQHQVKVIELGAQSFNPEVLRALGRSHSVGSIAESVKLLKQEGITVGLHLMLGCPRERDNEDDFTLEALSQLRPDLLRIHPLLVFSNTALANSVAEGLFTPISLEMAVERTAYLVPRIKGLGIKVLRLGLQDNEAMPEALVGGPYHPAFGDLVKGRILRAQFETEIQRLGAKTGSRVEIHVPQSLEGSLKGQNQQNLMWLKARFALSELQVSVLQGASHYAAQIRLCNTDGSAQLRQIESLQ